MLPNGLQPKLQHSKTKKLEPGCGCQEMQRWLDQLEGRIGVKRFVLPGPLGQRAGDGNGQVNGKKRQRQESAPFGDSRNRLRVSETERAGAWLANDVDTIPQ